VAKSSTESEYIAASEASSEAVWMKRFIHYNKPPHIASHALQRFKNALQNTDVATDICVGKSIRYGLYE
jgi:hypothetical protein